LLCSTKLSRSSAAPVTTEELIDVYAQLASLYPIYSIEDGLAETDVQGWKSLTEKLRGKVVIVGDDLFATSPERVSLGTDESWASGAVIKPNQVGTITEALQALDLCRDSKLSTIVSHRSGETNDTFIAEFAVGTSAGFLKAGGCSRGERMAKYNQLLRIEDSLLQEALDW